MTDEAKYTNDPGTLKRFKYSFILFAAEKHKEIRIRNTERGMLEKTTDNAKLVSEAWINLSPKERAELEVRANIYMGLLEVERAYFRGPWKIPANMRCWKDQTARKRPVSAFLSYSRSKREELKRENPRATDAQLSKIISKSWRDAPMELKQKYIEEAKHRNKRGVEISAQIKNSEEEKHEIVAAPIFR